MNEYVTSNPLLSTYQNKIKIQIKIKPYRQMAIFASKVVRK